MHITSAPRQLAPDTLPSETVDWPAGQAVHEVDDTADANVPLGHVAQGATPAAEKEPSAQR